MKLYVNKPNVVAGITLKQTEYAESNNMALHVSEKREDVIENRLRLAHTLEQPLETFVCAEQTHSANVYKVTKQDRGRGTTNQQNAIPNTDALYTRESGIVLCTFTADCVPVFFYNEKSKIIGVIHSGWSGTIQEITPKTLQHISEQESCCITDFYIKIGTALSQNRFEVDEDVFVLFDGLGYATPFIQFNEETTKYHIDNQRVIETQCERIGIPKDNITIDNTCTYDSEYGFSYREDHQSGRHMGFIFQK